MRKFRCFPQRLLLAAGIVALLSACDNYSLTNLLTLPGEGLLAVKAASTKIPVSGTTSLKVTGGAAPYSFTVSAQEVYTGTPVVSHPIGGVYGSVYTAGTAIGRMLITVTDAENSSVEVYVEVVPPTPSITSAPYYPENATLADVTMYVVLNFQYDDSTPADKLVLQRAPVGGSFATLQEFAVTDVQYDNDPAPVGNYIYRLYALAGNFKSLPSDFSVAPL